jgi:hypothetical protein
MTDFDISSIAAEIDAGTFDAPSSDQGQQQQAAPSPQQVQEYSYQARGKEIKEPIDTILKRASMGYDYAQLMQQHKQREAELAQRDQQLKELEGRWKPYDEYAKSNPQWADFVKQSWDQRFNQQAWQPQFQQPGQDGMQQQQQASLPPEIAQKLGQIDSFISQIQAEKQAAAQAESDLALNNAIEATQKKFPEFDLRATDPATGESMEMAVLKHAQLNGINSFEAAFKDMYFDQLLERRSMKAKEDAAKALTSNVRKGFLGQSNEPMIQNHGANPALKARSYHELMDIAAKDLGL